MLKPDLTGFTCFYSFRIFRCFYTGRHQFLRYSVRLANRIWRVLRTGRGPTHCISGREYAQRSASFQEGLTASFRLRFSSAHQRKKRRESAQPTGENPSGIRRKRKQRKSPDNPGRSWREKKFVSREKRKRRRNHQRNPRRIFSPLCLFFRMNCYLNLVIAGILQRVICAALVSVVVRNHKT